MLLNPPGIGGPIAFGTPGSVLFVGTGGLIAQDNANFNFDNATDSLFLGGALLGTQTQGSPKRFKTVAVTSPGHGPWIEEMTDGLSVGVYNPIRYSGYNLMTGGSPETSGEPGLAWVLEADYYDGANHVMEQYIEYRSADLGTLKRPFFLAINRDTQEQLYLKLDGPVGINTTSVSSTMDVLAVDPTKRVLTLRGAAAQSAAMLAAIDGSAVTRLLVQATGQIDIESIGSAITAGVTPVAAAGAFSGLRFQIDTTGLTGSAGWTGFFLNRVGTAAPGGSAFLTLQDVGANVYVLNAIGEVFWKPLGLSGFSSFQYDGANTYGLYGFFRATNAADGVSFRNALTTDNGTGMGFRFSLTTTAPYTAVTNLAARVLIVGNGQTGTGYLEDVFSVTAGGHTLLTAGAATVLPLEIVLAASQSANAFEVRASDGTTKLAGISAIGRGAFGTGPLTGSGLTNDAYSKLDLYGFGGSVIQFVAQTDPGIGDYAFSGMDFALQNPDAPTPLKLTWSFGADGVYPDSGTLNYASFYVYDWTNDMYPFVTHSVPGGSLGVGFTPANFAMGGTAFSGQLTVYTTSSSRVPLSIRSSAAVDATQWMNDAGTITYASVSNNGQALFRPRDAGTNTILIAETLGHASSATPAAGYGAEQRMTLQSSTTAGRDAAGLSWEWATATDATRKARGKLTIYDTAVREAMRWEASGTAPMIGFLGSGAVVQQAGASAAGIAAIIDPNAKAAITALQNALAAYGLVTAPA